MTVALSLSDATELVVSILQNHRTSSENAFLPGARRSSLREKAEREGLLISADLKKTLDELKR